MKLNLKDQSWAHEKQRNTIKSKYVISAIFKPLFILPPFLLFLKKMFLFLISSFFGLSNLLYE